MDIYNIVYTTGYLSATIPNNLVPSGSVDAAINTVYLTNSISSGIVQLSYNENVTLRKQPNPIAIIYKN